MDLKWMKDVKRVRKMFAFIEKILKNYQIYISLVSLCWGEGEVLDLFMDDNLMLHIFVQDYVVYGQWKEKNTRNKEFNQPWRQCSFYLCSKWIRSDP